MGRYLIGNVMVIAGILLLIITKEKQYFGLSNSFKE